MAVEGMWVLFFTSISNTCIPAYHLSLLPPPLCALSYSFSVIDPSMIPQCGMGSGNECPFPPLLTAPR